MITEPDVATRLLIRLSAVIAAGGEGEVRNALQECQAGADPDKVEEVILQSHLFCGFPRALNAAREWRRVSRTPAPGSGGENLADAEWQRRGERTCAVVYGESYERLRENIRALHPALDDWMIIEGYGRVLSRPQLNLRTRELCIVAACAASRQERQLHSHLHGALNAGASEGELDGTLECISGLLDPGSLARARSLWAKVKSGRRE
jgi:4-carboxymuconolactone decarboxylase